MPNDKPQADDQKDSEKVSESIDNMDIGDMVDDEIANMPIPDESKIDRLMSRESTVENGNDNGEAINERVIPTPETESETEYATDANGNPVYNRDGTRQKKRGRKKGQKNTSGNNGQSATQKERDPQETKNIAQVIVATICGSGVMLFGNAWIPQESEVTSMVTAWENYLATQSVELPPWAMVAIASGMYALPRLLTDAETQNRLKKMAGYDVPETETKKDDQKPAQ